MQPIQLCKLLVKEGWKNVNMNINGSVTPDIMCVSGYKRNDSHLKMFIKYQQGGALNFLINTLDIEMLVYAEGEDNIEYFGVTIHELIDVIKSEDPLSTLRKLERFTSPITQKR